MGRQRWPSCGIGQETWSGFALFARSRSWRTWRFFSTRRHETSWTKSTLCHLEQNSIWNPTVIFTTLIQKVYTERNWSQSRNLKSFKNHFWSFLLFDHLLITLVIFGQLRHLVTFGHFGHFSRFGLLLSFDHFCHFSSILYQFSIF